MISVKNKVPTIFLLPSLLTIMSLFCGYYAIILSFSNQFSESVHLLCISLILDGLDGTLARITKTTSKFGAELDGFADIVSFGISPALVLFKWKLYLLGHLGWSIVFIFCACAGLRLARFNSRRSQDNNYFIGLPSPAASVLIIGFMYIANDYKLNSNYSMIISAVLTIFASISMISTFKYFTFKNLTFYYSGKFTLLLLLFFLLLLIIISPHIIIYAGFVCYTLSAYILLIINKLYK